MDMDMDKDKGKPEQPSAAEAPQTDKVFETFAFGSVVEREVVTIHFPGMDHKWFVAARAPDAQATKRIQAAPLRFGEGEDGMTLTPNAYAAYIAKCEGQVVDFCLPRLDAAGRSVGEVRYNAQFIGANREVYDSLNEATMRYIEGALDQIAGRETGLAEQFEAAKNASAPSAKSG